MLSLMSTVITMGRKANTTLEHIREYKASHPAATYREIRDALGTNFARIAQAFNTESSLQEEQLQKNAFVMRPCGEFKNHADFVHQLSTWGRFKPWQKRMLLEVETYLRNQFGCD